MVVPYNPNGVVNVVILVTARASGLLKQMGMIRDAMASGTASWRIARLIQQRPDYPFETVYGLRDYRLDADRGGSNGQTSKRYKNKVKMRTIRVISSGHGAPRRPGSVAPPAEQHGHVGAPVLESVREAEVAGAVEQA